MKTLLQQIKKLFSKKEKSSIEINDKLSLKGGLYFRKTGAGAITIPQ